MLARLQARYPVVITFLGSDIIGEGWNGWHDRLIGRTISKLADADIVMSDEMARYVPSDRSNIIPFGVDTRLFYPQSLTTARKSLGLPLKDKLVLFPWDPQRQEKRYKTILAAAEIINRHFPTRVLAIHNQEHIALAKYMNACDVLVLASEHEGSPMAVREALACNLPVVSVDVGDVATVIDNVDNCFIAACDPEDIATKVRKVFNNGRRSNGYRKIKEMDAAWGAEKVYAIYERLLDR